jgi:glycosyltransferase involved in cell wall biosynthesis
MKTLLKFAFKVIQLCLELVEIPLLALIAFISRWTPRPIDIGLGPMPLINNVYHKRSLELQGYRAETFVDDVYFITNEFDRKFVTESPILRRLIAESRIVFLFTIFRYRCLYVYFNGGPLYATALLWRIEPLLYRLAGVRTVVMPYGGDVQDVLRTPNLLFRHVMALDYPLQRHVRKIISTKIDIWSSQADHVIAGCDWVDYMHFWHTLMISHFSIDTSRWLPDSQLEGTWTVRPKRPFRVLHAPNHKAIKGSDLLMRVVAELQEEGESIELLVLQKLPNEEIRKSIDAVDLVADQLIIGWYAMFAIEAMAMGKPVLCYLREDLERLYVDVGLLNENEIPLINCRPSSLKETLRVLIRDPSRLKEAGSRGREYVRRHHSVEAIGAVFSNINKSIGVLPRGVNEVRS